MSDKVSLRLQWRDHVASENGPPHPVTRHVLLTLEKYMDRDGGQCFPSIRRLALDTALSERCVRSHLQRAENDGWVYRWSLGPEKGQGWRRYQYQATFPELAAPSSSPSGKGAAPDSARSDKGAASHSIRCGTSFQKVRHDVPTIPPSDPDQLTRGNIPQSTPDPRERGGSLGGDGQLPDYAEGF